MQPRVQAYLHDIIVSIDSMLLFFAVLLFSSSCSTNYQFTNIVGDPLSLDSLKQIGTFNKVYGDDGNLKKVEHFANYGKTFNGLEYYLDSDEETNKVLSYYSNNEVRYNRVVKKQAENSYSTPNITLIRQKKYKNFTVEVRQECSFNSSSNSYDTITYNEDSVVRNNDGFLISAKIGVSASKGPNIKNVYQKNGEIFASFFCLKDSIEIQFNCPQTYNVYGLFNKSIKLSKSELIDNIYLLKLLQSEGLIQYLSNENLVPNDEIQFSEIDPNNIDHKLAILHLFSKEFNIIRVQKHILTSTSYALHFIDNNEEISILELVYNNYLNLDSIPVKMFNNSIKLIIEREIHNGDEILKHITKVYDVSILEDSEKIYYSDTKSDLTEIYEYNHKGYCSSIIGSYKNEHKDFYIVKKQFSKNGKVRFQLENLSELTLFVNGEKQSVVIMEDNMKHFKKWGLNIYPKYRQFIGI